MRGPVETAKAYRSFRRLDDVRTEGPLPAKVFLPSGKFASEEALPGMQSIYNLVRGKSDLAPESLKPLYGKIGPGETYYSASLGLLSNCGASEASAVR